jgi:indole-3-glycerol phosphate synthase
MAEMADILRRILRAKQEEVRALKAGDVRALEERADRQEPARGFRAALAGAAGVALVAEVKKASPSAGVIREDFDPVAIARAYERGGAAAVSILTDRQFFQGDPAFLARARRAVELPLLRKDFLLDPLQVLESRAIGADACLLIAAALEASQLDELLRGVRALGMDALVEVHDEAELGAALSAGADLVGINNRDLRTFEVKIEVAERLAPRVPEGVLLVAESGIKTAADVRRLYACGVKAVLVGEALMREPDVESAVRRLLGGSF